MFPKNVYLFFFQNKVLQCVQARPSVTIKANLQENKNKFSKETANAVGLLFCPFQKELPFFPYVKILYKFNMQLKYYGFYKVLCGISSTWKRSNPNKVTLKRVLYLPKNL